MQHVSNPLNTNKKLKVSKHAPIISYLTKRFIAQKYDKTSQAKIELFYKHWCNIKSKNIFKVSKIHKKFL